jgi:hypothetical protein
MNSPGGAARTIAGRLMLAIALSGTSWLMPWKVTLHLKLSKVQELPVHDMNGAKTPEMEPPAGTDAIPEEVAC